MTMTMTKLKPISYLTFCRKFQNEYQHSDGHFSLRPSVARKIAKRHGYKIADMHNIIDDAKRSGRL